MFRKERKMEEPKLLTIQETAKILQKGQEIVRRGCKQGKFPFAICIDAENEEQHNNFIIPEKRLEAWLNAEDLKLRK